jgi:hypothetical protein
MPPLCAAHLEAVAVEERRRGTSMMIFVPVQIGLFQLWISSPETQRRAGYQAGPPEVLGDADLLPQLVAETGCLACWAGPDEFGALLLHVATGGTPGAHGEIWGGDPRRPS